MKNIRNRDEKDKGDKKYKKNINIDWLISKFPDKLNI